MQKLESFRINWHVRSFREGSKAIEETFRVLPEAKNLAVKVLYTFNPGSSFENVVISESEIEKAFLLKELRNVLDMKKRRSIIASRSYTMDRKMEIAFDNWDSTKVTVSQKNIQRNPFEDKSSFNKVRASDDTWEYTKTTRRGFLRRPIIEEQVSFRLNDFDRWSYDGAEPYYATVILEKRPKIPLRLRLPLGSNSITAEIKNGRMQKPQGILPK